MWIIEFYEDQNGNCPTQEFLDGLNNQKELPHAIRLINLLKEFGNNLRRPHADYLENGIYELRIPVQRKQYRILYFYFHQDKIILSHGLRKEDKVPKANIDKALKHKEEYFSRHERKNEIYRLSIPVR